MSRYTAYKSSGIEWIDEIPSHWDIRKLSRSFRHIGSGTTPQVDKREYYEGGTIPWINTGDLNDDLLNESNRFVSEKAINEFGTLRVYPKGSIVIAMYGATIGKLALTNIEACTNQACCVLSLSEFFHNPYVFYWLYSQRQNIISLAYGGGQPNISQELIRNLQMTCPPLPEQRAITAYLDEKTKLIDDTIAKKQQLIQLLLEERTAMINQAVTRGLDPNVKLKPSGVEWLGDVPEHWEITKIKFIKHKSPNAFVDGPFGSNLKSMHFVDNGDVYVVESGLVTSGVFKLRKFKTITYDHFQTINRSECKEGDIIISKIGANYGMAGILPKLDKPSVVSGNSLKLTVNNEVTSNRFIHLVITMLKVEGAFTTLVTSTAQPALSLGELNDVKFALPPIDEQVQIVDFILQKSKELDDAVDIAYKEIDLLNEYRCTLINEVVTGKVCVLT